MLVMVATKSHLWLNMVDIKEKEKNVLLDLLVSSSEPSGTYIETVVGKFSEARG